MKDSNVLFGKRTCSRADARRTGRKGIRIGLYGAIEKLKHLNRKETCARTDTRRTGKRGLFENGAIEELKHLIWKANMWWNRRKAH